MFTDVHFKIVLFVGLLPQIAQVCSLAGNGSQLYTVWLLKHLSTHPSSLSNLHSLPGDGSAPQTAAWPVPMNLCQATWMTPVCAQPVYTGTT